MFKNLFSKKIVLSSDEGTPIDGVIPDPETVKREKKNPEKKQVSGWDLFARVMAMAGWFTVAMAAIELYNYQNASIGTKILRVFGF